MALNEERTQYRLLEAACEIFAEKAFRDVTVADICERADANIASVNYHYGNKAALYQSAWRKAFEDSIAQFPLDAGIPEDATAEEQFRAHIGSLIGRFTAGGAAQRFQKMYERELINPTGLLGDELKDVRRSAREHLATILRKLLGPRVSEEDLQLTALCILSQCRCFLPVNRRASPMLMSQAETSEQMVGRVRDHIVRFSLDAVKALRLRHEAPGTDA